MQNPQEHYPTSTENEQQQSLPGTEAEMQTKPDHGEDTYRGCGKLTGRKAIITGGGSGIERAVAIAFAREGADVLISYLNEEEDAKETARFVEEAGQKAILVPGDISDEAQCQYIIRRAIEELGGLDILVNNAAFQMERESLQEIATEEWDRTFRVNINAMFYLCKAAEEHLKPGSTIVNTTSVNAYKAPP